MKPNYFVKYLLRALGVISSLWLLMMLFTALIQINQHLANKIDINRSFIGRSYSYNGWKNLPFKQSTKYKDKIFLYGKAGIYYTGDSLKHLINFNKGLPSSAFDKEVNSFCSDSLDNLWVATNNGIYFRTMYDSRWHKYNNLPSDKKYIYVSNYKGYMMVYFTQDSIVIVDIDQKYAYKPSTGKISYATKEANILYDIHSGKILGKAGRAISNFIILLSIFMILHYYLSLIVRNSKYSTFNLLNRYRYFRILINSIFSIVILLFLLGLLLLTTTLDNKVVVDKTIEPQNIRSVSFNKETDLYYFIDDHGIFKFTPEAPQKIDYIQTPDNAINVSQINNLNKDFSLIATSNGLLLYDLHKKQATVLDSNKSLGSITIDDKTIYNVNNQGIYSVGINKKPFNPILDRKITDRMSISELAQYIHSGENSPFVSSKWFHRLNLTFVLIILLLIIVNITMRYRN